MAKHIKVWRRLEFDAGGIPNDEQRLLLVDEEGRPAFYTREYLDNLRKDGWKGLDAIPEDHILP